MTYYSKHSKEYIEKTIAADMSSEYKMLESLICSDSKILDIGFGSGRDLLYFTKKGYDAFGIDIEERFVEHAISLGLKAMKADILSFESNEKYDCIWCSACLLHLKRNELEKAYQNIRSLLKDDGILFLSMKYSDSKREEIDSDNRQMTYFNEEDIHNLPFKIIDRKMKQDPTRINTIWVNLLLKK